MPKLKTWLCFTAEAERKPSVSDAIAQVGWLVGRHTSNNLTNETRNNGVTIVNIGAFVA